MSSSFHNEHELKKIFETGYRQECFKDIFCETRSFKIYVHASSIGFVYYHKDEFFSFRPVCVHITGKKNRKVKKSRLILIRKKKFDRHTWRCSLVASCKRGSFVFEKKFSLLNEFKNSWILTFWFTLLMSK